MKDALRLNFVNFLTGINEKIIIAEMKKPVYFNNTYYVYVFSPKTHSITGNSYINMLFCSLS